MQAQGAHSNVNGLTFTRGLSLLVVTSESWAQKRGMNSAWGQARFDAGQRIWVLITPHQRVCVCVCVFMCTPCLPVCPENSRGEEGTSGRSDCSPAMEHCLLHLLTSGLCRLILPSIRPVPPSSDLMGQSLDGRNIKKDVNSAITSRSLGKVCRRDFNCQEPNQKPRCQPSGGQPGRGVRDYPGLGAGRVVGFTRWSLQHPGRCQSSCW